MTSDQETDREHHVDCPVCRDETFQHRDFLMDHLQIKHRPAEVYVAMEEKGG